jgi:glutamate-1-semialdehyde 2,1-aminomutase
MEAYLIVNYQERLLKAIPGGAHTYSRGYDQFPTNAPAILNRGKGSYVFDSEGKRYLDYGMGIRSVNIGYAEKEINDAVVNEINKGNNLTRPSMIELEAAELMIDLIDSVDMVKFTKNGSTAVSAAVKLSRAFTGKEIVARCAEQPFFSYDDWFISSTPIVRGIPGETLKNTKTFQYNNINSLETLIQEFPDQIACVVLEPAYTECPSIGDFVSGCCSERNCTRSYKTGNDNYLKQVQKLCNKYGIVFILDETITGFRWDLKGAQHFYEVTPDLCTFGKAMANGFSVACVAGKREIMELGSIEFQGRERVFLLSTTHGAEMGSLGAFIANVDFIKKNKVIEKQWKYGKSLIEMLKQKAKEHGIESNFVIGGPACLPYFVTMDVTGSNSLELRTLFSQEMIKNGVLMPWISLAYRHGEEEFSITENAVDASFRVFANALNNGVSNFLVGPVIKPVFRKFN